MDMVPAIPDDNDLLTSAQVRARIGNISAMTLWRWVQRGTFPPPVQVERRNFWRVADLRRWQAERVQRTAA